MAEHEWRPRDAAERNRRPAHIQWYDLNRAKREAPEPERDHLRPDPRRGPDAPLGPRPDAPAR